MVYSIDPAQWTCLSAECKQSVSYVRPSLTVLPYTIANNLPYFLVSEFQLLTKADSNVTAKETSNYFFTDGHFSNKTILLAWESGHVRPFLNALLDTYGGNDTTRLAIDPKTNYGWPGGDYNTIWRVTLDENGSLTIDNSLYEGIDSAKLPVEAPNF